MKERLSIVLFSFLLLINFPVFGQENDSINTENNIPIVEYKASVKDFILPAGLLTAGIIAATTDHKDIISLNRSNHKSGDASWDYLLLGGVAGSMFVFDQFIEAKNKEFDQAVLLLCSAGLSIVPAYLIKENYDSFRPDGGKHSFPSGHATTGFMIAHVLNKEFRDSNPWIAYGGYVVASGVSIARVAMNKHWICDILAGAGFGILGTELAYLIYFPIRNKIANNINRKKNQEVSFSPILTTETLGMNLSIRF